ncbi:MAG: hypothetical protein CMC22_06975 [Flavobacteriaceae bacterium]|nr:hypothetical protein [Flavobacteriaceae bacterium]
MSRFKKILSLFFFDKNEKKFIKYFTNINNRKSYKLKKKKILVSVIDDYYWLCRVASAKHNEFKNYELIGYWPQIIKPRNKADNQLLYFLKNILRPINYFFIRKKWFYLYKKIGITKIITPEYLNKKYGKEINYNKIENKFIRLKKKIKTKKDIHQIKINNYYYGDLIYDSYLRYRNLPTVNLNDKYLDYIIYNTIKYIDIFEKYSKNIDIFFSIYSTYVEFGLPVRVFLKNKKKVITDGNNQYFKVLTKKDWSHVENYSNFRKDFKKIKDKQNCINISKKIIKNYFFNQNNKSSIYSYLNKNFFTNKKNSKIKNLDGVIFLPNFFEAQREWGKILFNDFYEWIFFTIDLLKKANLKFMIKPHPNINTINKESKIVVEEIKLRYPEIKWLSSNESNYKIFKSVKFGISMWGSVLWELAYFKKIAIACGNHPGKNYNFIFTPRNIKEFEKLVFNINKIKNKRYKIEEIYEYIYMFMLKNNDAFINNARNLNLKKIHWQNSDSLDIFLKKYSS